MKYRKFITRALALPMCVLVTLFFAGPSWALGINFSVKTGAVGAPGTAVNAASDPADIYVGGGGTNVVRIPKAMLGLQPGDEVDALTIYHPGLPFWDQVYAVGVYVFSVDDLAVGLAGAPPDVFSEAAAGEAAGDIFLALPGLGNAQVLDESVIGLAAGTPPDDQDALQIDAPAFAYVASGTFPPPGSIAFSLAAGSPTLALIPAADEDVLLNTPGPGLPNVFIPGAALGIPPGDDLNALFVDVTGFPVFSVDGASGILLPCDILVPDGVMGAPDGVADVLIPGGLIGLLPIDNLNALDGLLDVPLPPEDPDDVDTDGDTLPDYWEEREGLDPNDDGSGDPDMGADGDPDADGATNRDEYDAGTDPRDPGSTPVPLTAPWAVAVLAVAIVAAARKRLT